MITPLALFAIWLANQSATVLMSILSAIHSFIRRHKLKRKCTHLLLFKDTALTGNKCLYHSFYVPDTMQKHQLQLILAINQLNAQNLLL